MIKRPLYIWVLIFFAAVAGNISANRSEFTVTFASVNNVYIDGGEAEGLLVGDRLSTMETSSDSAFVEIVFTASHSSSCKLISGKALPAMGQTLQLYNKKRVIPNNDLSSPVDSALPEGDKEVIQPETNTDKTSSEFAPLITGNLSIGYYHWNNSGPSKFNYSKANTRLNFKARGLWNKNVTLKVRSRGRYNSSRRNYASNNRSAWENRLWEFSLAYESSNGFITLKGGRLLPRHINTVGYIDGALLEIKLSESVCLGVFGGNQPDLLYDADAISLIKGGGYLTLLAKNSGQLLINQTLGVATESHSGEVNRTFMITRGNLRYGRLLGFSHSTEIDINTGWRKDRAGESISFSRAFIHFYIRPNNMLRFSVNYDNSRRYWIYEYINMADSLFDDRVRQGFRAKADWSPTPHWRLSIGGGLRNRTDNEKATVSYSFSVRRVRLVINSLALTAALSGFDGAFEHGINRSINVQYLAVASGRVHIAYRDYKYAVNDIGNDRFSWSLETGLDYDFPGRYYIGGSVQYNDGDDIAGWRIQTYLGYRL